MTTTYRGYYLLDHHRNRHSSQTGPAGDPNTRPWYTTRRNSVVGIVIHTPETLEDFVAPYDEADRVARYGADTTRASWHDTIDADSIIPMLPPGYTAWQVRGYNSSTVGMEIGAKATSWSDAPDVWVSKVLANAATRARQHALQAGVPIRRITRAQLDRAIAAGNPSLGGFIGHAPLDPTRRTDPGADFPWGRFLELVREGDDMVDRDTDVGANPVLAEDFAEMREAGVFTSFTEPGGVVFKDELAAFLNRYEAKVVAPLIDAKNKTAWSKAEAWVRDHVKTSIAAALAAGAGGAQVDYSELLRELGRVLVGAG